jgi:integrase
MKNTIPETTTFSFNKKTLEGLSMPSAGKRAYYWDTQVRGLCLDVTSRGHKSFYFKRTADYKRQQLLLGRFPELSVEEARKKALEIGAAFARGENPADKKRAAKIAPSFGSLLNSYIQEYATQHCLAHKEMAAVFRRYLEDWKDRKFASITRAEIQRRVNEIGKQHGPMAANHTITYARAGINWCIRNGLISGENPWANVPKFKMQARDRFLKPDEIGKFFAALKVMDNDIGFRDYIYLSLFTGARRNNVLSMRWSDIDFDLGTWTIPRIKNGDSQIIPLTRSALQILSERNDAKTDDEWVFPGDGETGHVVEPKKAWNALLKKANIQDLHLHDLRRTLGSYMAMGNQSLPMIGKVLGHRSPTATQIYSRFAHDPIRAAMEKAHADMLTAAKNSKK